MGEFEMEKLKEKIKTLLEKFKSLDKKIQIASIAGVVVVIAAIIVTLVLCLGGNATNNDKDDTDTKDKIEKEDKDESDDESEDEEEATFLVKVVDAEGNPVAGVSLQLIKDESLTATSDDTGVATFNVEITEGYKLSGVTCPEGYEYTGEAEISLEAGIKEYTLTVQKKAESTDGGNTATQQPTTTNPNGEEIFGAGSKEQPYLEIPNLDNMTLTTVSIPAGKTLYYGIQRVGNMILTINNANAYVIESNGTRHDASGGKVSFTVESALASDYVMFQIGNKGGSATSFTLQFSNPTGSQMNPTIVSTLGNDTKVSLAEGDADGHYYKYIAEKNGTIRFYLTATADSTMYVTNNANSAQRSFEGTEDIKTDEQGKQYIELEVTQGNEIIIQVGAKPNNRGKYSATTITWSGKYN